MRKQKNEENYLFLFFVFQENIKDLFNLGNFVIELYIISDLFFVYDCNIFIEGILISFDVKSLKMRFSIIFSFFSYFVSQHSIHFFL